MTGRTPRPWFRSPWFAATAGAVGGFLLGSAVYVLLTPVLEGTGGLLRETQGLVWNLVPLLTVVGGVLGHVLARDRPTR